MKKWSEKKIVQKFLGATEQIRKRLLVKQIVAGTVQGWRCPEQRQITLTTIDYQDPGCGFIRVEDNTGYDTVCSVSL